MAQSTIKSLLVAGLVLPIGLMQGSAFAADSDTPAVSQGLPKLDLSPVSTPVKPNAAVPGVPSLNADYVSILFRVLPCGAMDHMAKFHIFP